MESDRRASQAAEMRRTALRRSVGQSQVLSCPRCILLSDFTRLLLLVQAHSPTLSLSIPVVPFLGGLLCTTRSTLYYSLYGGGGGASKLSDLSRRSLGHSELRIGCGWEADFWHSASLSSHSFTCFSTFCTRLSLAGSKLITFCTIGSLVSCISRHTCSVKLASQAIQ